MGTEICENCSNIIFDKYYLKIKDLAFHESCLQCSICRTPLENSCFTRRGKYFCKADYDRHCRRVCEKCNTVLYPEDMVFRENFKYFHYNCLLCSICGQNLHQGDEYICQGESIICKTHFLEERSIGTSSDEMFMEMQRSRDGRRGPKRPRTILTAMQRRQFKASFEISPKPCRKVREALAKETGLSVRVVQVWFQNQRAKMKKMHRRGKVDSSMKRNEEDSVASDEEEPDDRNEGDAAFKTYMENDTTTPIDKLYLMQDSYFTQS